MDSLAKEYIVDFFSKKLSFFGDKPSAVGWSDIGQKLRYECILRLIPINGKSILDFGCGKGDLYGFFKERNIEVDYTGIDINPELTKFASAKYPDVQFLTLDIDSETIPNVFDYIILCGVFNLNIQGVKEALKESLEKLFHHTKNSLLFTCLSTYSKNKDINLVYFDPAELLSLASKITKSANLYLNLIEGDIFLLLNKNF